MDLVACRAGHRLIDVVVFRDVFGAEALDAVSGGWAAVEEERHIPSMRANCPNGLT